METNIMTETKINSDRKRHDFSAERRYRCARVNKDALCYNWYNLKQALLVTVLCQLLIPRVNKLCPFLCVKEIRIQGHNSVLLDKAFSVLWQLSKVFPKGLCFIHMHDTDPFGNRRKWQDSHCIYLKQREFNFKFGFGFTTEDLKRKSFQSKGDIQKCWCDALLLITSLLGGGVQKMCFNDSVKGWQLEGRQKAYHLYTQWISGEWCMFLEDTKCNRSNCNVNTQENKPAQVLHNSSSTRAKRSHYRVL